MSERVAVFCRTHLWDRYVAEQAERLRSLSARGHFYVLADETRSVLPVEDFIKFSHSDLDFEPLGLERYFNTNLLWYNGDYPLYKIATNLPHYDWYVVAEYDVLTNVDLVGLAQAAAAAGAEAVGFNFHPVEPEWPWRDSCSGIYEQPWRGLIPLLAVSRLAIEHLFAARRRLTQRFRRREIDRMPFCEAFVPTELRMARLNCLDLGYFGSTERFEFWPPHLEGTVQLGAEPAFIHPVLDERRYIPNRLRHDNEPESYFDPTSPLRTDLARCSADIAAPHLLEAFRRQNNPSAEAQLLHLFPALRSMAR
jgi:hypothetical protein